MSLKEEQRARLDKIRKLLAKAADESVPAPEAELLTLKAAELMAKYKVSQAMIDAADAVIKPASAVRAIKRVIDFAGLEFIAERRRLLHLIAEHYGATTVTSSKYDKPQSWLFGFESDLDLTEMLYTSLMLQAIGFIAGEDIPFGDSPRSFVSAWWTAYIGRINTRLMTMRYEAQRSAEKDNPGAEMILKSRFEEVMRLMREEFPETFKSRHYGGRSRAGRAAGYAAGSRANLGTATGISGGSASRALEG